MPFPYHALQIDSSPSHFCHTLKRCMLSREEDRGYISSRLERLWTTEINPNPVFPSLSVRTVLDLYLQAQAYSEGSEVIMTAINIQDVAHLIRHHKLKIIPVDISVDTLAPSRINLEGLVTSKTVAILVAHLYGRLIDLEPVFAVADKYNLHIIEDCAECFSGFSYVGDVRSDISLFSFGVIKYSTSFGGAIAKVKDHKLWAKMRALESHYPSQTNQTYRKKVLKYLFLYTLLYSWPTRHLGHALYRAGYDPKDIFVKYIRGFSQGDLAQTIRFKPCPALLSTMLYTYMTFDPKVFSYNRKKGDYFLSRLTPDMHAVGTAVELNNHWLFPVLVKNPDECVKGLNTHGISAYRGCTQLTLIEGEVDSVWKDVPFPRTDEVSHCQLQHSIYPKSLLLTPNEGSVNRDKTSTPSIQVCTIAQGTESDTDKVKRRDEGKNYDINSSNLQDHSKYDLHKATANLHGKVDKERCLNQHLVNANDSKSSPYSNCSTNFVSKKDSHHGCHLYQQQHPTPKAKYLIDHVIYLPINKRVPFRDLDKMAAVCSRVIHDKVSWQQSEAGSGEGRNVTGPPGAASPFRLRSRL